MESKRKKGTILLSSAVILCCVSFALGFVSSSLLNDFRQVSSVQQRGPSAVNQQNPGGNNGETDHIAILREEALKNPSDALRWTRLGDACYDAGKPDQAIEAYQQSLKLSPENADVMTDLGSMYRMKGQPEQAVQMYEQALAVHPGHRNAVFNKGVTLMLDMEQPENAVLFWRSILAQYPDMVIAQGQRLSLAMPDILEDAAHQLEARGRYDAALRAYGEVLGCDESRLSSIIHRADLLEKFQRQEEAFSLWKKALELDPQVTDPSGKPVRDRIR
jgi:tetratricopeptide (TPR) repeat protein